MLNMLQRRLSRAVATNKPLDAIIFIHWGWSEYRDYALEQAARSNPTLRVILISDTPYAGQTHQIENFHLNEFRSGGDELRPFYIHLSTNHPDYEYRCIVRWFVIREACKILKLNAIFHVDSDVLIFLDLKSIWSSLSSYEFSLSGGHCGHTSFWSLEVLSEFCEFILSKYKDDELGLRAWYKNYKLHSAAGGYCDMTALEEFARTSLRPCFDMTDVIHGTTFDHNINISVNGTLEFKMREGKKDITWVRGCPYGKTIDKAQSVRFAALHFQGEAKLLIPSFYREYSSL